MVHVGKTNGIRMGIVGSRLCIVRWEESALIIDELIASIMILTDNVVDDMSYLSNRLDGEKE